MVGRLRVASTPVVTNYQGETSVLLRIRANIFAWRVNRRLLKEPVPLGSIPSPEFDPKWFELREPSKDDFFPWRGGQVWRDGAFVYIPGKKS